MDNDSIHPIQKTENSPQRPRPPQTGSRRPHPPAIDSQPTISKDTVSLSSQGKQALAQSRPGGEKEPPSPDAGLAAESRKTESQPTLTILGVNPNQRRKFDLTDHHDVVMKIVDKKTQEVVKQVPSEQELKIREAIREVVEKLENQNGEG